MSSIKKNWAFISFSHVDLTKLESNDLKTKKLYLSTPRLKTKNCVYKKTE